MKFRFWIWCLSVRSGKRKSKRRFFLRRFVMHLGKDFLLVARIVMAIINAVRKLFEKGNKDDREHNGES